MTIDRGFVRGILGIAISVVAASDPDPLVDVGAAIDVLRQANLAIVALMAVAVAPRRRLAAARWRALLAPIGRCPYPRVLGYTYVGYLANNVLPARLGELVRSHALGEGEGISRTDGPRHGRRRTHRRHRDRRRRSPPSPSSCSVSGASCRRAVILGAAFVGVLVVVLGRGRGQPSTARRRPRRRRSPSGCRGSSTWRGGSARAGRGRPAAARRRRRCS